MSSRQMNLAILIPTNGLWQSHFGLSLLNMTLCLMMHEVPGFKGRAGVKVFCEKSSLIARSRARLLDMAFAAKCTHALFVDTDQTFPANTVHLLARHGKPVVAANVATKVLPSQPTARNKSKSGWKGGDVVYTDHSSSGFERVWRIGTGVMLIDLSAVAKLPRPLFNQEWREDMNDFVGEDWFFCERLEAAGIEIGIDHDVSKHVGHIGDLTYTHDYVGEVVKEEVAPETKEKAA